MNKLLVIAVMAMTILAADAQTVEKTATDKFGGTFTVSSSEKLFGGCRVRMCNYIEKSGKVYYGIELDMTDQVERVSSGNLFTIHFEDGSRISLSNLYDTQATTTSETRVENRVHYDTSYATVYDAWSDDIYMVPIDTRREQAVPVTETSTFADLYYVVTEAEINKIINNKIKEVSIVTDQKTIVKKAKKLSEIVEELFPVVKK